MNYICLLLELERSIDYKYKLIINTILIGLTATDKIIRVREKFDNLEFSPQRKTELRERSKIKVVTGSDRRMSNTKKKDKGEDKERPEWREN